MKSMKSEDLSKDLQGNPRIAPQMQGFHDEMDEKWEIKELDLKQTDLCLDLCPERPALRNTTHLRSQYESGTDRDCVKGNL